MSISSDFLLEDDDYDVITE